MSRRYVMHLVHRQADGHWHVEHNGRSFRAFETKADGLAFGRMRSHELADAGQDTQLVIHRQDGSVEHEFTYGNDPERHPG